VPAEEERHGQTVLFLIRIDDAYQKVFDRLLRDLRVEKS
jgi:hypothetical protein